MTTRRHGTLIRYKNGPDEHDAPGKGCRCTPCRAASSAYERNRTRLIAYGRWEARGDAAGTRRRLQALIRRGWSQGSLAVRLGRSPRAVGKLLGYQRVSPATAARVRALYDALWDQSPPERTRLEKGAATKARNYARARGWPPPQAWDDDAIDDPAASPAPGWERQDARRYGVLAEEAVELTGLREHPEMIASRLGVTPETVERTLQRAGRAPWRAAA